MVLVSKTEVTGNNHIVHIRHHILVSDLCQRFVGLYIAKNFLALPGRFLWSKGYTACAQAIGGIHPFL